VRKVRVQLADRDCRDCMQLVAVYVLVEPGYCRFLLLQVWPVTSIGVLGAATPSIPA